jgi:hypothetical protein
MTSKTVEIAYLRSSFVRVVKVGTRFEVQTKRFRGEGKAPGGTTLWKKLYGVADQDKAIRLLESYA